MEEDIILEAAPEYSSSSLRRKSFQKQNNSSPVLAENNDEVERLVRRCEMNVSGGTIENASTNNKRRSLGLGFLGQKSLLEIKDLISECIKLNTENKISMKNAFSLEIINLMSYMIKKQDSNMSNLQTASTSLDVSTKIYGFRVDGIHAEIMKMAGGLDKENNESAIGDVNEHVNIKPEDQVYDTQRNKKKERKRSKQKIFSTIDNLKGTVEIIKPSLWIMENEDAQTTDALYQVILPNHANSKYYLHFYNDVIVDTIQYDLNDKSTKVNIPQIENISKLEICPPLTNFEFQNWISDNENDADKNTESEKKGNEFQFDLDASLPAEDEVIQNDMNYFDIQDTMENVDRCIEAQKPTENVVDLCKFISDTDKHKTSEYSFIQKNCSLHLAGSSHWEINNFKKCERRKNVASCPQKPTKKRKEIEICYDDKIKKAVAAKFSKSKATMFDATKLYWNEDKLIMKQNIDYNITNAAKLYFHKSININISQKDQLNVTHISDIEDYNYNNENDTSNYCPYVPIEDYGSSEDNDIEHNFEIKDNEMIFIGDNLVTVPKLTNKICIAYSTRAKKIDMRQLKNSIWKILTVNNNRENIHIENTESTENKEKENKIKEDKYFSEIYKTLPNIVTKTNIEVLSFPISFVSLLHLANEKTLKIQSFPDMSDLIIEAN
ncbi:PREDICTED: condensin complex subunit 2-like [Eufriesea mexicana]|uniref:condensin complex subunit 2-like n=1 Tax=Eufriesea mexicana TaxID=516756 RepID=UPI00083C2D87|nr:PREDICTED: condensin complex subunit 2-like [Eufriesea mexicana]